MERGTASACAVEGEVDSRFREFPANHVVLKFMEGCYLPGDSDFAVTKEEVTSDES